MDECFFIQTMGWNSITTVVVRVMNEGTSIIIISVMESVSTSASSD